MANGNMLPLQQFQQPFNFQDDPGYQFRRQEGLRGIQQQAAARGTLGTGRTLKELTRFGSDLASQEYGAAHQRRLQEASMHEGLTQGQFGRAMGVEGLQEQLRAGQFGRQFSLANLGFQGAQQMAGLVNPTIPGWASPGGMQQINAPTAQAQLDPSVWAQLMQGASGNLANIGMLRGQGQLGASQAWRSAIGDISQMAGQQFPGMSGGFPFF